MEGIYWFRISAVAALVAGSVWFLLPTFLQESAEERLASSASGVEAPGKSGASLDVELPATGDPSALAAALQRRLEAAGVRVTSVSGEQGSVKVKLAPGTSAESVTALATRAGEAALFPPGALLAEPTELPAPESPLGGPLGQLVGALPPEQLGFWSLSLPTVADMPFPPASTPLELKVTGAVPGEEGTAALTLSGPFPAELPLLLLGVDGVVAGVVGPDSRLVTLGSGASALPLLASGPLPGTLGPPVARPEAPEASAGAPEAAAPEGGVPPWLASILPESKINLGLDLQGGIDLTLQVELEEAVLGQVQRDLNNLKEGAGREGLVLESVHRIHGLPRFEVATAAPLADLQTYLQKSLPEYTYLDSSGQTHRFEMNEVRRKEVEDQAVEQVLETLRKRVDATGVKEPSIVRKGGGRIQVQLPGMEDVQSAVDAMGTTAVLEFRRVDEEFDDAYLEKVLLAAREAMPPDQYEDDELLNVWLWDSGRLSRDRILLWEYEVGEDKVERRAIALPLFNEVRLTGNDVNNAGVGWDQSQLPYVSLEFKPRGGQVFCELTEQAVGKRFAVVLDDRIQSAPSIRERICGGQARIDMGGSEDPLKEAQTLALVLRTGALDAPVVVASVSQVGATLGADAVRQGTIAAVLGSLLVAGFMFLWYKTSGLVADVALVVNVLMILAVLAVFGATLTLPGIAGIALTAGMAVDSNIIVYERIREELKLGVQARKAVDAGFEKALVAIVDANITTAIAGIVMYSYGSGPLKGFAVTLLVGIVTTLVTAVFVTRTIMEVLTRSSTSRLRI